MVGQYATGTKVGADRSMAEIERTLMRHDPRHRTSTREGLKEITMATEEQAIEAKQASYGDARFLDDLPVDQRIEVMEIRETWAGAWTRKD